MIPRVGEIEKLSGLLARHPVVGIIGARQVGKTTLARQMAEDYADTGVFFDLENPEDLARLSDPVLALKALKGLVVHYLFAPASSFFLAFSTDFAP